MTPLANLKVLIAAASTALEQECASGGRGGDGVDDGGAGDDGGGRKMKSLSVLCQRYAYMYDKDKWSRLYVQCVRFCVIGIQCIDTW